MSFRLRISPKKFYGLRSRLHECADTSCIRQHSQVPSSEALQCEDEGDASNIEPSVAPTVERLTRNSCTRSAAGWREIKLATPAIAAALAALGRESASPLHLGIWSRSNEKKTAPQRLPYWALAPRTSRIAHWPIGRYLATRRELLGAGTRGLLGGVRHSQSFGRSPFFAVSVRRRSVYLFCWVAGSACPGQSCLCNFCAGDVETK